MTLQLALERKLRDLTNAFKNSRVLLRNLIASRPLTTLHAYNQDRLISLDPGGAMPPNLNLGQALNWESIDVELAPSLQDIIFTGKVFHAFLDL